MLTSDSIHILLFITKLFIIAYLHMNENIAKIFFLDPYRQYLIGEYPEQGITIKTPLPASINMINKAINGHLK